MSQAILQAIKRHKTFLISTHVNPDPDALASELALALYLRRLGKRVSIINGDQCPARYSFLPKSHLIQSYRSRRHRDYEVAIILDCGDLGRIGPVGKLLREERLLVNLDHHLTNDNFGDLNLVVPKASSTTEVLFDLLKQARAALTKEIAQLLYVGIMTDTGSFRYDTTSAHTHRVVAELMRFGFSVSDLYRRIYEGLTFRDFKLFTKVINLFESFYQGRVVSLELSRRVAEKFSQEFDLKDKIFSFLRAIKGVEVIIIYAPGEKNQTRVNFRSQGERVNVAELAFAFGGGGHRKASGCIIEGTIIQAKRLVMRKLREML